MIPDSQTRVKPTNSKFKSMKIDHLRKEYARLTLIKSHLKKDPLSQLRCWLAEAIKAEVLEPNAMFLATADKKGKPSSRLVLLKEIDAEGIVFFTNYRSRKSRDIEQNPFASASFFWKEQERQATFFGKVVKITEERSEQYFQSRPRASQISAWASRQGEIAASRMEIDRAYALEEKRWKGRTIEKPPFWGGFRLVPQGASFWQGREKRLHDHFLYKKRQGGRWDIERLFP